MRNWYIEYLTNTGTNRTWKLWCTQSYTAEEAAELIQSNDPVRSGYKLRAAKLAHVEIRECQPHA